MARRVFVLRYTRGPGTSTADIHIRARRVESELLSKP